MLAQEKCVSRFLARKTGRASGLLSTGEALLDHSWYVLACWEGDKILWNPFPYPTPSSRRRFAVARWYIAYAGYAPVGAREGALDESILRHYSTPCFYHAVLSQEGATQESLVVPDERLPGARFHLALWDFRASLWRWEGVAFWSREFARILSLPPHQLARAAHHRQGAWKARAEADRIVRAYEKYFRLFQDDPVIRKLWWGYGGNGYARLAQAKKLKERLSWLLETPEGVAAVVGM